MRGGFERGLRPRNLRGEDSEGAETPLLLTSRLRLHSPSKSQPSGPGLTTIRSTPSLRNAERVPAGSPTCPRLRSLYALDLARSSTCFLGRPPFFTGASNANA